MNDSNPSGNDTVEPKRLPHRRTDWYSARTIDAGIRLQAKEGTQAAAIFFRDHSIVPDITIRTLLHPERRRNAGE